MSEENIEQQGEYQLVIQNDHLVNNKYAVPIVWNKEGLKIGLQTALKKYKDMVVTEDKLPEAKSQRAKLNGLRTTLDNERKRIKFECLSFYTTFESDVKELMALVDEPIKAIDGQLDVYEQRRIDEKTDACKAIYNEIFTPEIAELIPFTEISVKQWYNKGYSLANVRQDLADMFKQIQTGIASIKALNSKHELSLLKTFYETRDMATVLSDKAQLDIMDKRAEEQARAAAERKAIAAEAPRGIETPPYVVVTPRDKPERTFTETFRVTTTKAKFLALKAFFDAHNIKPERL